MSSLKDNRTCALLEQYLSHLVLVKGRSPLTADEYRIDCNLLFEYLKRQRGYPASNVAERDFSDVDIGFIRLVTTAELYDFLSYCSTERKICAASLARKIVSIKQFWKHLAVKAHLLDKNVAEELEAPKLPRRMPKYLSLDESIRLLLVGLCLTSFLQGIMMTVGLLILKPNTILGIGLMLAAAEVPRIAGAFGLDTSMRVNVMGAVHGAQTTVNAVKSIATAVGK